MQQSSFSIIRVDDPAWWEDAYRNKRTPWDLGRPAPPLESYLKSPYAVPPGKLAVLGCGYGHDCMPFLNAGFEVTGIDFAQTAVATTYQKFQQSGASGSKGYLLHRDVFNIHEYDGYYDYVLDHCFFASIDASRRRTYIYTVADLLKPKGKLIGLFWVAPKIGGPPFALHKDDIYEHFDKKFTIDVAFTPSDSVPQRKGGELLTVMTKR
jgi:methyl halide transferase